MPAKYFGAKHICVKCQTKFYDLKKPNPACPQCGTRQQQQAAPPKAPEGRRSRLSLVPKVLTPLEMPDFESAALDAMDEKTSKK